MSRRVRDAGKGTDEQRFREAAIQMVHEGKAVPNLTTFPVHPGATGAWVPVEIFVTWAQAGVDRANFDLEDES